MDKYRVNITLSVTTEAASKGQAFRNALKLSEGIDPGGDGLEVSSVDVWRLRLDKDGNPVRDFSDD